MRIGQFLGSRRKNFLKKLRKHVTSKNACIGKIFLHPFFKVTEFLTSIDKTRVLIKVIDRK